MYSTQRQSVKCKPAVCIIHFKQIKTSDPVYFVCCCDGSSLDFSPMIRWQVSLDCNFKVTNTNLKGILTEVSLMY